MAYPPGAGGPGGPGGFGGGPPQGPGGFGGGPPQGPGGFGGGPPQGPGGFGGGPPQGPGGFGGGPPQGPGGFGGGYRAGGPPPPGDKDEQSKAKIGMILSLIGLPLCCFPLGLVGGYMGFAAMQSAKRKNLGVPGMAYVAMVCGGLGLALTLAVGVGVYAQQQEQQEHLDGLAKKLDGKRTMDEVDKKTACLLAEEFVVGEGFDGKTNNPEHFSCAGGDLRLTGRTAQLTGVSFNILSEEYKATACLARGARWFVVKVTGDAECGKLQEPEEASADGQTEEQLKAAEKAARDNQSEADANALVEVYSTSLVAIRKDAASVPDSNLAVCKTSLIDKRLGNRSKLKIKTVDYNLLNSKGGVADGPWKFLTSDEIRSIVKDGPAKDKQDDIQELKGDGGNLLLVYRSLRRAWPIVTMESVGSDDFSYDTGDFAGYMMLYDMKTGERLCHSVLEASNSDRVSFREGRFTSNKAKAEGAVFGDFKDNFETRATARIKRMHPKLKLGYQFLE